jgi:colicin import membrane protein
MSQETEAGPVRQEAKHRGRLRLVDEEGLLQAEGRPVRFILASLVLHGLVGVALFVSFGVLGVHEDLVIPEHIQAHVASASEMEFLRERKEAQQQKIEQAKAAERQKELERQRKVEEAARQKREAEARKKVLLAKQQETERKDKERKEKEQKQEQERKRLEQQEKDRREQEKKERERKEQEREEKDRLDAEQREQDRVRREREQALTQKLEQTQAEQRERAAAAARAAQRQAEEFEQGEVSRFKSLIKSRVEAGWKKPPESSKLMVLLQIRLFPNGEVEDVQIVESSGVPAFDRSAMNEVKRNRKFPVPENKEIFERHFRKFNLLFRGEA